MFSRSSASRTSASTGGGTSIGASRGTSTTWVFFFGPLSQKYATAATAATITAIAPAAISSERTVLRRCAPSRSVSGFTIHVSVGTADDRSITPSGSSGMSTRCDDDIDRVCGGGGGGSGGRYVGIGVRGVVIAFGSLGARAL